MPICQTHKKPRHVSLRNSRIHSRDTVEKLLRVKKGPCFTKQLDEFVYEILFFGIEIFGDNRKLYSQTVSVEQNEKGFLYSIPRLSFTHRANALGIFVCAAVQRVISFFLVFFFSFSFISVYVYHLFRRPLINSEM